MNVNMLSSRGWFTWPRETWRQVLMLAWHFGWQPIGTRCPDGVFDEEWDGDYLRPTEQVLTTDDGRQLANALERALASSREVWRNGKVEASPPSVERDQCELLNLSSNSTRKNLADFILFCRAGEFEIC